MKNKMIFVLVLLLGFSLGLAKKQDNPSRLKSNKVQVLVSGTNRVMTQNALEDLNIPQTINSDTNWEEEAGLFRIKNYTTESDESGSRSCPDGTDQCWDLSYMGEGDAYYYLGSGGANDTFAIVMTPAAPCIVQEVYQQWFSAGNAIAFGADYGAASAISPDGNCYDIPRGSTDLSPIGTLRTNPTPNTIDGYISDWSAAAQLDIGGTFQVGDPANLSDVPPFVIAYVKGGDTPEPLAMNNDVTGRTETYTWLGGPWNADSDGLWGRYHTVIENMLLVKVTYPWGAPIAANPSVLPNTYATTDTRTIEVDFFDDLDANNMGINGDDEIHLYVAVNGVQFADLTLADAYPIDVDAAGNGIWGFDVTYSAAAGDVVSYWVHSIDNDGLVATTTETSFEIKAPVNPDADLLIINDGGSSYYLGGYEAAAAADGYVYEVWETNANAGIDWSVINWGWSNILVFGWGNSTLPVIASEIDPGYGDFVAGGGNLMLVDHDWFYGHSLDSYPVDLTFGPGDPAYDWFGISGGSNDPDYDDEPANGGAGDTTIVSLLAGLTDLALRPSIYGTTNWTDFMTPDLAEPVYQGFDTEEIVGVRYDSGTFKTALFSFMADAAVDTLEGGTVYYKQEFYDFVSYFLSWFGVQGPPYVEFVSGPSGTVFNDTGQLVTATASDANGDPFTVELEYTIDGGATWMSVAMTDDGTGLFSGTIPAQAGGSYVDYRIAATDDDGTFRTGSYSYFVYAPASEILFVLNNEMDADSYPGLYYFYDAATGGLWTWPDFWLGGVSAELLSFYDIVFEVTSTGTWGDFTDHYDVVQAWLAEGNKSYFLAGDETFGLLNGTWADEDFGPGTFLNDIGVAHSYNDIGAGGTSALDAAAGDFLAGDLYDSVMGLGDGSVLTYDPTYEIGLTNWLDGVEPTADASPFIFDQASGIAVGVWKEWDNGNKTVYLGFDPLSLNSAPTYVWWGATDVGPTKKALDWFQGLISPCSLPLGDATGDGNVDVLDVVSIVGYILGTNPLEGCQLMVADANEDGGVDVLDVVLIVNWILTGGPREDNATSAKLNVESNQVSFDADGYVGAFQITITHEEGIDINLTNSALVADYVTNGTSTTMIIVAPEGGELFTASGDFEFETVLAASDEGYIDVTTSIPSDFALQAAYPNPFNPVTTIGYSVPVNSDVRVIVYDMLGRQVAELVNGNIAAGSYTVSWNASDLSSGMYLVRMIAGDFTSTQKLMLVK